MPEFEGLKEKIKERQELPTPLVMRLLRTGCGLTQDDVAVELGVTRPTVARYEAGTRTPRDTDLRRRLISLMRVLAERQS